LALRERDPAPGIEADTLADQQEALGQFGARTPAAADLALRIDDPMPGQCRAPGQGGESVANLASPSRKAGQPGKLAVGCHAAARDPGDEAADALIEIHGWWHSLGCA
jgi:hypothetical protein